MTDEIQTIEADVEGLIKKIENFFESLIPDTHPANHPFLEVAKATTITAVTTTPEAAVPPTSPDVGAPTIPATGA